MDKLKYPSTTQCINCSQTIYGCVCCTNFDDTEWWKTVRYGTFIDGWKFNHDNCLKGKEHMPTKDNRE